MGDFIAQIKILGNILVLWAIKIVNRMQRKPKVWVLGDNFFSAYVIKYAFG